MKTSDINVEYIQHTGSDLAVVNAARVSFNKESEWETIDWVDEYDPDLRTTVSTPVERLSYKDRNLIKYLAKHGHKSPFNHSFITLRVKAPIFVARQLVKHKFMPWNEVSRRYVDDEPEFYFPKRDGWREKADNVKQGSSDRSVDVFNYGMDYCENIPEDSVEVALEAYNELLKRGVCPEQARMVLPQNTMTEWWWSGTLGAYCDMLNLRLDSHTQKETRMAVEKVYNIIHPLFPVSVEALVEAV